MSMGVSTQIISSDLLIYHPNFKMVGSLADFRRWEVAGLDRIRNLGTKRRMISETQMINRMGYCQNLMYQYIQVRCFLKDLLRTNDIFRTLTIFFFGIG